MSILDIKNRTENWNTAKTFAPFFGNPDACRRLACKLFGQSERLSGNTFKLELFWKGMRDHWYKESKKRGLDAGIETKKFIHLYDRCQHFSKLREHVSDFDGFDKLKRDGKLKQDWNYQPEQNPKKFFDNLLNTEIDIVLETTEHLFIGEAKDESSLGTNGDLVLVHQLIRQYVMATILMNYIDIDKPKRVVPFLVVRNVKWALNTDQVKFMIAEERCWLKKENVLSWDCIKRIANAA